VSPRGFSGAAAIWLVVQAAALVSMAWIPGASGTPLPLISIWALACVGYAGAASSADRLSPRLIWGGAIGLRLALVGATPMLSEDVYRYVWDGWVSRNGLNPFAYPPAAPDLTAFRTEWWDLINHPAVPTIYPPGAQMLFLGLAVIGPGWLIFKLAWLVADLLVAWLLSRLAEKGSGRRLTLFLYLWSPLVLVEVAWSGHFESVGIAAMLGAILMARRKAWVGGALLGLGAAIKFAPLAAVPALARKRGIVAGLLALAVPALLYIPYMSVGWRMFDGLRTYADIWQFNAGFYGVLSALPGPDDLGRWIGAASVISVAFYAAFRRWGLGRTLYWTIGAGLLVSPTIHPWYVLWVLPLACLYRGTGWIVFSSTVFLAYAGRGTYLTTGVWPEPFWLRLLIHGPLLILLARDGLRLAGSRAERLG
jgi:alpha-1,6-mannosyltransferase